MMQTIMKTLEKYHFKNTDISFLASGNINKFISILLSFHKETRHIRKK